MAGIDKTYAASWREYRELKRFMTPELVERSRVETKGQTVDLYRDYSIEDFEDDAVLPVWNTTTLQDLWIVKNVDVPFVQARLREQYDDSWIGWLDFDLSKMGYVIWTSDDLEEKNDELHLVEYLSEDAESYQPLDEIIVYGDSKKFFNLWNATLDILRGWGRNKNRKLNIKYEMFGLKIHYKDGQYYLDEEAEFPDIEKKAISYGVMSTHTDKNEDGSYYEIDNLRSFLHLPSIKYSLDIEDAVNAKEDAIVMSNNKGVANLWQYSHSPLKDRTLIHLLRGIIELDIFEEIEFNYYRRLQS